MLKMIIFTLLTFIQGISLICTILLIMANGFQSLSLFNYLGFFLGNVFVIHIMITLGKKIEKYERQIPNSESENNSSL